MSTRAIYSFQDAHQRIHVYKHHDGYPKGALAAISLGTKRAFALPRFEADDFAAAFVAANKSSGGDVRLCGPQIREASQAAADAAYHYVVTCFDGQLWVEIASMRPFDAGVLYYGPLSEAPDFSLDD